MDAATSPMEPSTISLYSLTSSDFLNIFKKTNPITFTRLRKATKLFDEFCLEHGKLIGVHLYKIELATYNHWFQLGGLEETIDAIDKGVILFWELEQVKFVVQPYKDNESLTFEFDLATPFYKLSGFSFEKVKITAPMNARHPANFMLAHVRDAYFDFIKDLNLKCTHLEMNEEPVCREIAEYVKPKVVWWRYKNPNMRPIIPRCARTFIPHQLHDNFFKPGGVPYNIDCMCYFEQIPINDDEKCQEFFFTIQNMLQAYIDEDLPFCGFQGIIEAVYSNDLSNSDNFGIYYQNLKDFKNFVKRLKGTIPMPKGQYNIDKEDKRTTTFNSTITSIHGKKATFSVFMQKGFIGRYVALLYIYLIPHGEFIYPSSEAPIVDLDVTEVF